MEIARRQPQIAAISPCVGNAELGEVVQEGDLTELLLDVCELALCRLNRPELSEAILTQSAPGSGQLQAVLSALQAVLKLNDSARPLSLDVCCDLMLLLIDVSQVSRTCKEKQSVCLRCCIIGTMATCC